MTDAGARYRFGPRERPAALAGWRAGQILTVAFGLGAGVLALRAEPNPIGIAVAVGLLLACVGIATWPVSGRTGDEWCPVLLRWVGARGKRRRLRVFESLVLLSAGHHAMGVVQDRNARTLTAALALRGQSFALLGPADQDRRVGGWSSVLASLSREGSPVRRVQWVASSFPDEGHGTRSYLASRGVAAPTSPCAESYQALLSELHADGCTHSVVLAVQVRQPKVLEDGCKTLEREVVALARQLHDADVIVDGILSVDDLAHHLLRTYTPRRGVQAEVAHVDDPWPMAMEEQWSTVRVDGMVHATYWIAEWPRVDVRSDFLAPLLICPVRSTLAVVMEPLGPDKALRKVEASRTADLADAELRRRGGFMATARHARESEVLARREEELADGHASFRFTGFVTVSAPTPEELETACDTVLHAAGQCRLLLRRLYGDQAMAYTCTLPLGRGLT